MISMCYTGFIHHLLIFATRAPGDTARVAIKTAWQNVAGVRPWARYRHQ